MNEYLDLFGTFAKVGVMTFGGGYAMLPILQREVVEHKGWATEEELMDYFAIGQCTPGVIAVNTATFIGQKHRGWLGGIVATLGVVFPSLVIISILAGLITNFSHLAWVQNAFAGIQVCVCVLIFNAVLKLLKKSVVDKRTAAIFLIVMAGSLFLHISPVWFVVVSAVADDMLKDSLNAYFISACFGDKYIGEKPENVVKQYTENYISEYRRDLEPMYTEDEKDKEDESSIGAWYSYYKGIESHVQLYEKDLLVYRIDYNEYTGGAHGIYMTTYLNMDLTLMRPLRLDDIFVGDYKEPLTDLIWNQLMADNKVTTHEALEDMGYASTGDITPTENFYLSREGVTFYYNVYDITPYSMGPVKVTIPFPMLEHLLGSNPILGELKD